MTQRGLNLSLHGLQKSVAKNLFPSLLNLNKSSVKQVRCTTILPRLSTLVWNKSAEGGMQVPTEQEVQAVPSGNRRLNQTV